MEPDIIPEEHLQEKLNEIFKTWPPHPSGDIYFTDLPTLAQQIDKSARIIDVGCGLNLYKQHFVNLIGIDPATDEADYKVTVEEFVTDRRFEIAFCFGSINYGSESRVKTQIAKTVDLLEPENTIYWRQRPYIKDNPYHNRVQVFDWTLEKNKEFCQYFGYTLDQYETEPNTRVYAKWIKSNT